MSNLEQSSKSVEGKFNTNCYEAHTATPSRDNSAVLRAVSALSHNYGSKYTPTASRQNQHSHISSSSNDIFNQQNNVNGIRNRDMRSPRPQARTNILGMSATKPDYHQNRYNHHHNKQANCNDEYCQQHIYDMNHSNYSSHGQNIPIVPNTSQCSSSYESKQQLRNSYNDNRFAHTANSTASSHFPNNNNTFQPPYDERAQYGKLLNTNRPSNPDKIFKTNNYRNSAPIPHLPSPPLTPPPPLQSMGDQANRNSYLAAQTKARSHSKRQLTQNQHKRSSDNSSEVIFVFQY